MRNITWYNPSYGSNVKTNLGQRFLKIIDKCFRTSHALHKMFNCNTVKVSYSCRPNVKAKIDNHNRKLMNLNNNDTKN
jgi:hypothetical protein